MPDAGECVSLPSVRRVARALRAGGPEVIEIESEALPELKAGEALVRVASVGLNHSESLVRSGKYVVKIAFPYAVGGEGAGTVMAVGPETALVVGTRVCWGAVMGSCADWMIASASMLVPIADELSFEDAATLPVACITAGGLARVWQADGRPMVVWGAAGAVGRMLVAILTARGVPVIGIASGDRVKKVRRAGATHVVDREAGDVVEAVRAFTGSKGAAAVYDPIGAATFGTSMQLLGPRGCLISYGELSGAMPPIDLHRLFAGSVFVTRFNGMRWVEGFHEFAGLVTDGLELARKNPGILGEIAARFPLDQAADAYRALDANARGKVLVTP